MKRLLQNAFYSVFLAQFEIFQKTSMSLLAYNVNRNTTLSHTRFLMVVISEILLLKTRSMAQKNIICKLKRNMFTELKCFKSHKQVKKMSFAFDLY